MKIDVDYRARRYLDVFNLPSGQINISEVRPGIVCAFHKHNIQDDHWIVVSGELEVMLASGRSASEKVLYTLKDGLIYVPNGTQVASPLYIPKGYWHGYRNVTLKPAVLIYYVTEKYNSQAPDEERMTPEQLGIDFPMGVK